MGGWTAKDNDQYARIAAQRFGQHTWPCYQDDSITASPRDRAGASQEFDSFLESEENPYYRAKSLHRATGEMNGQFADYRTFESWRSFLIPPLPDHKFSAPTIFYVALTTFLWSNKKSRGRNSDWSWTLFFFFFWLTQERKNIMVVHKLRSCHLLRAVDYLAYGFLGSCMLPPSPYDQICMMCLANGGSKLKAEDSSCSPDVKVEATAPHCGTSLKDRDHGTVIRTNDKQWAPCVQVSL